MRNTVLLLLLMIFVAFYFTRQFYKYNKAHPKSSYQDTYSREGVVRCGEERWEVKTLSDSDEGDINFDDVVHTTVSRQVHMQRPEGRFNDRQASEDTEYVFRAYVKGYKKEKDQDIHIVIADIETNETMVAEIANPECETVKESKRYDEMKAAHNWFIANIGKPHNSFRYLEDPPMVTIKGIGFWDFLHGQKGMAHNGREIHPVLSMVFAK